MKPATAQAQTMLQQHGLRVTDHRQQVLTAFLMQDFALSHMQLELQLPHMDRVTLYRTLHSFTEKGLLHRVLDDSGAAKYALCPGGCTEVAHAHDHAHFKCDHCGHTFCLDGVRVPAVELPRGFRPHTRELLLTGTCPSC